MAEPVTQSVVIACPQCGTRYRLSREVLGGQRLVQCASCKTSWHAPGEPADQAVAPAVEAEPDHLFDAEAETQLEAVFETEARASVPANPGEQQTIAEAALSERASLAEITRAIAPKPRPKAPHITDAAALLKQRQAFSKRQALVSRRLPTGRLRHSARVLALTMLMVLLGGGIVWRNAIVAQVPDLAGVYAAVGLPVTLAGLTFENVQTLETLTGGVPVLTVSGRIASAADAEVPVPPVVVTLLGQGGAVLYQWSVAPRAGELKPGESVDFETQLKQPPQGAVRVRLGFGTVRAPAAGTEQAAEEHKGI